MIRKIVVHAFEGGHLHDLCVFLCERLLYEREGAERVKLWSPQARDDFRSYSDFPGLPDIVYTTPKTKETYVIELETSPSRRVLERKQYQFYRNGITDVIVVPLDGFKDVSDWRGLEKQLEEWLP